MKNGIKGNGKYVSKNWLIIRQTLGFRNAHGSVIMQRVQNVVWHGACGGGMQPAGLRMDGGCRSVGGGQSLQQPGVIPINYLPNTRGNQGGEVKTGKIHFFCRICEMYEVYLLFKYTFNSPSMRSYDTAPTIVTYPTAVPVTSTCSDKLLPASHFFKPNNYTTAHSLQILAVIGENYTYFVEPMSYFTIYIDRGHYQLGLYFSIHCQYIYIKSGI